MPRLTFSFGLDGLIVPALMSMPSPTMQSWQAQGTPLPAPLRVRGMFDTGTTITAVTPRALAQLQATPHAVTQTTTAAGPVRVNLYQISFTIYDLASGATLTRSDWTVSGLLHDLEDVDVLFGIDLVREIALTVDGPNGRFTLDC